MKKEKMFLIILLVVGYSSFAQQNSADLLFPKTGITDTSIQKNIQDTAIMDGYYNYDAFKGAKPIPLPKVSMNNVRFYKRIYRDIDLKDTANSILVTPGKSLIEIILEGIRDGRITAFDASSSKANPTGDAFTVPMRPEQAMATLVDSVLVPSFDSNGNQTSAQMKLNDFNPASVTKFRIKEDIFYDKQRSRIETRIIGLAPLRTIAAAGELINEQAAFWVYYPQCRNVFVTKTVTDPNKNIYYSNFDDVFLQHNFKSKVVKEASANTDNPDDAEKIEKQIAKYKKDTWKY
jgi:gliding motility associated protien GldN